MKIWFFEEFPDSNSLERARLLNFQSTIFIAAKSYKDFERLRKVLLKINNKVEAAYWPILDNSYWISPFANTGDLIKLYKELKGIKEKIKVLIDLELPIKDLSLFWKNLRSLSINKRLIKNILNLKGNLELFTAVYPPTGPSHLIMKLLGMVGNKENQIIMCYTSMVPPPIKILLRRIKSENVGIGVTTKGIVGNEHIITPEELENDLTAFSKSGSKTATIFRLGGINKNYLKVINNFL